MANCNYNMSTLLAKQADKMLEIANIEYNNVNKVSAIEEQPAIFTTLPAKHGINKISNTTPGNKR